MSTVLLIAEVYAAWCVVAMLTCFLGYVGFASWDSLRDMDAQRRMDALIAAQDGYLREERLSMELDYILSLPTIEPWERWT